MNNLAIAAVYRQIARVLAGLALLACAAGTSAQVAQPFRAALAGAEVFGCVILPIGLPALQWLGPPDTLYEPTDVTLIDSGDGVGVLAVLSDGTLVRITPDNSRVPFFSSPTQRVGTFAVSPETGNVYATLRTLPGPTTTHLGVISPQGVLTAAHPFANTYFLAAAARGCTFYFVKNGLTASIGRFDACTGTALPDIPTTLPYVVDLDVLANGQLLLTTFMTLTLHDPSGALVRTYVSLPEPEALERGIGQAEASPDGTAIWYTRSGCDVDEPELIEIAFDTGAELSRRGIGFNSPTSLVVSANSSHAIPTASEWALIALAAMLGIAGIFVTKGTP